MHQSRLAAGMRSGRAAMVSHTAFHLQNTKGLGAYVSLFIYVICQICTEAAQVCCFAEPERCAVPIGNSARGMVLVLSRISLVPSPSHLVVV